MARSLSCRETDELLPEFLDGGLEETAAAGMQAHLAGCARCAALRDDLRATLALVHTERVPEPPAGTWERFAGDVRAKIRRAEEAEGRGGCTGRARPAVWDRLCGWAQRTGFAPVAVAAAAAVLLAIGVARNQAAPPISESDVALVQDLDVLRAVDRPDDLEMIERLPALLDTVRAS